MSKREPVEYRVYFACPKACGYVWETGYIGPECAHMAAWHEAAAKRVAPILARLLGDQILKELRNEGSKR